MSVLENESIPVVGGLVDSIVTPLTAPQQTLIAEWSMKTAMMSDSMKGRNAPNDSHERITRSD